MNLNDRILFIDGEAIVLDKPAGLAVDAPRAGGDSIGARLDELKLGFHRAPSIMHRLDRDTSGCLLLARNPKARARFQQAFEAGLVEKEYLAIVAGIPGEAEGLIDLPLAKHSTREQGWRMVADPAGASARTRWQRIAVDDGMSLIRFWPLTGRTHQLRAHAAYGLEAPVIGDPVYGSPAAGGMMLHAARLRVPRQPRPAIDVSAPLPARFGGWRDAA